MANTQLGIVSPTPKGDWIAGDTYQKLSIVRNGNASYQAKTTNTNIEPGVTSGWQTYWMLLNEDGTQGEPGPQGEPGVGVPTGGLAGQLLAKSTNNNYDTVWILQSQIEAGSAVNDENGNNIAQTYETKQHAQETFQTKTDSTVQQTTLQNQITTNRQLISRNSHRLDGLEQRIKPSPFITDSNIAYQKDVPSNAVGAAEIKIIGGMTYRDQNTSALTNSKVTAIKSVGVNLLAYPFNEQIKTSNGVTWIADNGGITGSGVPISVSWLTLGYINIRDLSSKILYVRLFGDYQNMRLSLELLQMDGSSITTLYVYKADSFNLDDYIDVYRIRVRVYRESNNTTVSGTMYPIISTVATSEYIPYRSYSLPIPEAVQLIDGYGESNPDDQTEFNYVFWDEDRNCYFLKKGSNVNGSWVALPAPTTTNITTIFTADNMISVEGNGTLTFVNDNAQAVPSTVEFITA